MDTLDDISEDNQCKEEISTNDKQIKLINTHIKVCNELFYLESRVEEINNDLCRLISKLNNVNCLIDTMRKSLCDSI